MDAHENGPETSVEVGRRNTLFARAEYVQKDMEELRVEATSGGGMVTVVTNGAKQLISLKIDPEVVSKDDVEMLQDLILAAVNDAHRKADDQLKKKVGGMMPGM